MTNDAQSALRRIIEKYTSVTRFCLICNYVSRIIEPLGSRCVKFRFKALPPKNIRARLRKISDLENVKVSDETLDLLLSKTKGDLRRAITLLQSTSSLNENKTPDERNSGESLETMSLVVPTKFLEVL